MSEANEAVLQYEILEEKAHTLGRTARQIVQALDALRLHDGNPNAVPGTSREDLVADAAESALLFNSTRTLRLPRLA